MTRIATVGYLNAEPLTSRIDRDRFEVVADHPSVIARMLASGEVDVALVPVAAALTDGDFRVVGQVCIGAEGPVHSVLLVAETPPEAWTEVVLDGVSRTSRTLARLLLTRGPLADRVSDDLVIRDGGLGEGLQAASGTVAGLVIGDAARDVPGNLTERLDLAELWHDWTGHPFVFAVWAGRPDLDPEVVQHLKEAGHAGLAAREQDYSGADLDYVTRSIRYALDDRALIGLRRYAALAHADGLVGTEHVQLYGPLRPRRARRDLDTLLARAADGEGLEASELAWLDADARTGDLALAADLRREHRLGARGELTWSFARTIVVTDVDVSGSGSWRSPGDPEAVLLTPDEVAEKVVEAADVDAGEIHLVGGLHPGVGVEGWCRFIAAARAASDARVHALTLEGLRHLSSVDDRPVEAVIERLREAGLDGLVEGAILALDSGVRRIMAPESLSPRAWLGLAEVVHRAGLPFATGLEVGAGESRAARLAHLADIADLHGRTGGVSAFRVRPLRAERKIRPDGATAQDHLRTVSLARLALDGIDHHEAIWLQGSPGLAQAALHAGADRLAPVQLPERIEEDGAYYNPRAAALARKKQRDPWAELSKTVDHHLKHSGFTGHRHAPEPRVSPAPTTSSPRPSA